MRRGRGRRFRHPNPPPEEDEYGGWGDYFSAKKAKLGQQLNATVPLPDCPQIFAGVSVYINGYTNPPEPELRAIFTKHGGEYTQYLTARTTFVIATNLPLAKKKLMWHKTLKPEWITESVKAGVKLDHRNFSLYNTTEENKQKTLTQVMVKHSDSDLAPATSRSISALRFQRKSSSWCSPPRQAREDDQGSKSNYSDSDAVGSDTECSEYVIEHDSTPERDQPCKATSTNITPIRNSSNENSFRSGNDSSDPSPIKISVAGSGNSTLRTTADEGFLDDFYKNSRLHLISTMKKETQYLVADWRKNISTHKFTLLQEFEASCSNNGLNGNILEPSEPVIFHIDLDCFFVAVGRLSRPHLIDMPVAVCHSKGTGTRDSKSDVACASYEARQKGVSAGMWLDEAKRLCPEIQVIPYDFEEYKRVSKIFFETVASFSLEIEAISCDEMYLNATTILKKCNGSTAASLASFMREAIQDSSKVKASIGIGTSKLSARIATRIAKENSEGQHEMSEPVLKEYIRNLSVGKLPGVGYATVEKLYELYQIRTCLELEKIPLKELNASFGAKNGEKLYWLCRGVDKDPINCDHSLPKSLSAGCSFGVRFNSQQDANKFTKDLANELSNRATQAKCFGNKLTLNLWIISKERLNDPVKPGGHGAATVHSRTRSFLIQTRDAGVIYTAASELARSITQGCVDPEQIRGVRISFDSLRYESEMSSNEKKTVQNTIASSFAAMKGKRVNPSPTRPISAAMSSFLTSPVKPKDTKQSPSKTASTGIMNYFRPKAPKNDCIDANAEVKKEQQNKNNDQWIEQNTCTLEEIDPSVWKELPSEIQAELKANQLGHPRKVVDSSIAGNTTSMDLDESNFSTRSSNSTAFTVGAILEEPQPCCSNSLTKFDPVKATNSTEGPPRLSDEASKDSNWSCEFSNQGSLEMDNTAARFHQDGVSTELENSGITVSDPLEVRAIVGYISEFGTNDSANAHTLEHRPNTQSSGVQKVIPSVDNLECGTNTSETVECNASTNTDENIIFPESPPVLKQKPKPLPQSNLRTLSASKMPTLNGSSTLAEIKGMISAGTKGRLPRAADRDVLESYLIELVKFHYLGEACELIQFLWDCVPSLKKQGGTNKEWADIYLYVISQTEKMLLRKFGGVYHLPPHQD